MRKLSLLIASFYALSAHAAWQLQEPALDFITTKIIADGSGVTEVGTFADVSGSVNDEGGLNITIQPLSVRTGVDIRDERLGDWVFKAQDFPQIQLMGDVDLKALQKLKVGQSTVIGVELNVTIRDHSEKMPAEVIIVRDDNSGFYVSLRHPLIIDTSAFDLDEGIGQLVEVANLNAIVKQVPVLFSGHFVNE